jgi:hypothetical protein
MTFHLRARKPKPPARKYKYPVLFQVRDVENDLWDVRDIRATRHGFDVLYGSPVYRLSNYRSGPCLIVTKELFAHWEANKTNRDGALFDLPAGRTTLKRARSRLSLNDNQDLKDYWNEHIHKLKILSAREFAACHNLDVDSVFDSRLRVLGKRARHLNWWRTPDTLEILRSNVTLREIGEKLGIGTSHAKRLRDRARLAPAA